MRIKKLFDDKINEINSLVKKKTIILKTTQKKFKEIQIYVKEKAKIIFIIENNLIILI